MLERMTTRYTVPSFAYISAFGLSFVLAGIVIVAFLQIGPTPSTTYVVPPLVCGLAALFFALKWPQGSWRWGVILSCGLWAFFVVVFLSYLSVGQLDWLSGVRALSVLMVGMVGSASGTYLRYSAGQH